MKGWFSAMLKLQQRNAEAIENGAGSITTECKGFDFSITLGDDFKIATDKETQKEIIERVSLSRSAVQRMIKVLSKLGRLERVGSKKTGSWIVKE